MTITIILTILASLALVATVYYAGGKMSGGTISQINEQVRALSKNLSLPEPKISQSKNDSFHEVEITGSLNNRSFNFQCFTKKINTAESFTTRFSLAVRMELDNNIHICKEGLYSTLQKQFGKHDIDFQDPAFDEKYLVHADQAPFVQHLLNAEIRSEMIKIERFFLGQLRIHKGEIQYEESGLMVSKEDLHRIQRLITLAEMIASQMDQSR